MKTSRVVGFLLLFVVSNLVSTPAQAALTLSATANVDTARPLSLLNVEFTVGNTDAFARNGITIEVTYPAGLNQVLEAEFDGDCVGATCTAGETVTWTIGTIAGGESAVVDLPVVVAAATANGTVISFSATVTDDLVDVDSASADVDVNTGLVYALSLAEDSDPATAGSLLTYQISFGHRADAAVVNNTTLAFTLPASTTFVSASDGGALNGGDVEWPLGNLNPGDGGVRAVTVSLNGGLAAATVVPATAEIVSLTTPAQRLGASTATVIASSQPLSLAIETAASPARPGELLNIQLTVTNNSAFTRFGVLLRGRFPQSLDQAFESEFGGNCSGTTCTAGERIIWTLGDIPAGGSATAQLPPFVSGIAMGGTVMSFFMSAVDASGAAARQADTVRVHTDTRYDLSLSENVDPVSAGSLMTYTSHFGYREDAVAANNSMLVFELPVGTSFVSATQGGAVVGSNVEWALGFLSPGDGGIREVTVQADNGLSAGTVIEATAFVSSITAPIERARAEANAIVASAVGLELGMETNPTPAQSLDLAHYQFTVTNNSAFTRFGVMLNARYPQDLIQAFESEFDGDCSGATCTAGERVTWTLGNIAAGASVTATLSPTITSTGNVDGELISFFAWASDDQGTQTRQMDTIRVADDAIYDLSLAENADPASPGDALTYTLTYGYRADASMVNNSSLHFPLPAGTSFVAATDGGVLNVDTVEWPLGFLSPGDGGVREVTVELDAGLATGEVIEAHADVFSVASPDQGLRAEADTVIAASLPLGLHIETNPGPVRRNELANYQFTVTNNDAFTRFGVELIGTYPQSLSQAFESEFDGDCGSSTCTAGERVTWTLGNIPAGGSVRAGVPPLVAGTPVDGVLSNFFMEVHDDLGVQARQMDTMRVQDDRRYELALAEDVDPVTAGSLVDYAITYGYRADAGVVSESTLRFTLPVGTTFVSASAGGVLNGNVVEWPLGFLSPGDGDLHTVTVLADGGLPAGTVLEAAADVFSNTDNESARAEADTTIVTTVPPLVLQIDPNRNNAEANAPVSLFLSVTNNSPFTRFGVALNAQFPQLLVQLFESEPAFDGQCGSTTCTAGELITWPLVDIPAGNTVTVELPPTVNATAIDGEIIEFYAWVRDDTNVQARDMHALLLGCLDAIDTDCDAISDSVDNCTTVPNLNQRDTDGDGFGNICDADFDQSCFTGFPDLSIFAANFGTAVPDTDLDGDGFVGFPDLSIFASLFGAPPGPNSSGTCP